MFDVRPRTIMFRAAVRSQYNVCVYEECINMFY